MDEITLYGAPWCPDCRRVKRLLGEMRANYEWIDIEMDPDAEAYVRRRNSGKLVLPLVVVGQTEVLTEPTAAELAECLGVEAPTQRRFFDVLVVGAGPAGLTAALAVVREGMRCLVIEAAEPGGQAGSTPYLFGSTGFPEGAGGDEVRDSLLAQAHRYGVRILSGTALSDLQRIDGYLVATTEPGEEIVARAVILATGVRYAELGIPGEDELRGAGVHGCASCEGPFYRKSEELLVVGGGDLAGQEALFLTQFAQKVRVVDPAPQFSASAVMIDRLRQHPKIELYTSTEVVDLQIGEDGSLAGAVVRDRTTGYVFNFSPAAVFVYAGMRPNTEVFEGALELDEAGFILTDHTLQSSMAGVFVAGDVRTGSTKQLGSAISDGSAVVLMVRQYLEGLGDLATRASA